jgi:hypothetical protein
MPNLRLHKIATHRHIDNAYRVVLRLDDGSDLEIGSIGEQAGSNQRRFWSWGIDTVLSRQPFATEGEARDREDVQGRLAGVRERSRAAGGFMQLKLQRR